MVATILGGGGGAERELPVVVVGAGPVGLAAAARLAERGLPRLVLEAGPTAGTVVRAWPHVRLFSRWAELIDPVAAELLAPAGWVPPDADTYPPGSEWAERYLDPLAAVLSGDVRFGVRVVGAARRGRDRVVDAGRDTEPLTVHLERVDGTHERISARALVDASGTWSRPNPLAGSGHSALTALVALADLAREHPGTHVSWLLRRATVARTFGGGAADQLPARGALGLRAAEAAVAGHITTVTGFRTVAVHADSARLVLESVEGRRLGAVDEVIVLTGFRPDLSWLSELRLDLDPRLEAPRALAPLIDPNVHSCGTVSPHGAAELTHPEPGVFLAGMKSYGRAPTFLAVTGYEQVRSIAAELAGDRKAAERVELVLPETGVCGGTGLFDAPVTPRSEGCCGNTPRLTNSGDLVTCRPQDSARRREPGRIRARRSGRRYGRAGSPAPGRRPAVRPRRRRR